MRILVPTLAFAALALTGCAMTPAETARAQAAAEADRAALGQQLAGLRATKTGDCLDSFQSTSLKAYGSTLVYRVNQNLVYVNDTTAGCEGISRGDYLVTKSNFGRVCRGDIGRTFTPGSDVPTGSCSLGSFTTYRK
ncbi:hypothetical protein FPZ24_03165 [Sphingomonas panacisoli]|uniref:Lipoprotein n=1 Tax=Sphingomonas panacisoli TaxID=1813879 RepID=A0A5B8LFV0_9SPHN|nr:hypothetical protein [Sphingomonas panacisoli]QDZ06594.1 hypothetical protein FPZ24_03165 [Sphingomonas panacisoli]